MRKKQTLIFALLTVFSSLCHAQTTRFAMTLGTDLGLAGKNYRIVTPNVSATYDLTPSLSVGARVEDAITLAKIQGVKTYDYLATLGGQVSYDAFRILTMINVQPRLIVGHTIGGGHDRGYMYCQGGIYLKADRKNGVMSEIGFGIRHNNYRGDLYEDKTSFFVSYGFVLR
ncbi:hypothetical protein [Prevotella multiformis]|uniref:hypothetical protein n=1 Tax=Prevotella multiformis TaxID=282402 RepID=UPI003FA0C889